MTDRRSRTESRDLERPEPEQRPEQRYRRVAVRTSVRISTIDPETDPTTGAPYFRTSEETCGNVSRGGAYVETEEAVAPGRRLLVEIDLPEGERVQAVGRVAWTKTALSPQPGAGANPSEAKPSQGMGIEFLGASRDELQRIERLVSDITGEAAGPTEAGEPAAATTAAAPHEDATPSDANDTASASPQRGAPTRA